MHLGNHVTLLFEDEMTLRYQVQEMLRVEKIFEEAGIREELAAYNPLVPDGSNHFVRFELSPDMKAALAGGAQMMIGCDHPAYPIHVEEISAETLASLIADLR